jgi:hypothetical protein
VALDRKRKLLPIQPVLLRLLLLLLRLLLL